MDRHYATNVDFRRQRQIDRERETEGERKRERSILRGVDVFICMIIDDTQSMWSCQKLGCFFASEKPSTRLRCRVRNTWVVLCHKHICEFLNRRVRNTVVFSCQEHGCFVSETRLWCRVRDTFIASQLPPEVPLECKPSQKHEGCPHQEPRRL